MYVYYITDRYYTIISELLDFIITKTIFIGPTIVNKCINLILTC